MIADVPSIQASCGALDAITLRPHVTKPTGGPVALANQRSPLLDLHGGDYAADASGEVVAHDEAELIAAGWKFERPFIVHAFGGDLLQLLGGEVRLDLLAGVPGVATFR